VTLCAAHLEQLRSSGLTDETITACGFATLMDPKAIANALRWNEWRGGSVLAMPYFAPGAELPSFVRVRPDMPQQGRGKYEQPKDRPPTPYFVPGVLPRLRDPSLPALWVEGEKKSALLYQLGYAVVGAAGVDLFHDSAGKKSGARFRLHALIEEHVAIAGRDHLIVFDADVWTKDGVRDAAGRLAYYLIAGGADPDRVFLAPPPHTASGAGVDDFFVHSGAGEQGAHAVARSLERRIRISPLAPNGAPPVDPFLRWRSMREIGDWLDVAPPPRTWLLRRDGKGALARGIVALLVAPGGRGKSMLLVQLALAIATGRTWLDAYDVAEPGRVVLALAEEDLAEVRRRLYWAARALELSDDERRAASELIVPLGLSGELVGLVHSDPSGNVHPTHVHAALLRRLQSAEHACVILDPLSRWAPDVEGSNAAATSAVQALEQLTKAPGAPTVIVAHHTSQWSRREGNKGESAGARGVTGLTDGVRFVAALTGVKPDELAFVVSKSNYAAHGEPIDLVRDPDGGILRPPTSLEIDMDRVETAKADAARSSALQAAVLEAVRAQPGCGTTQVRKAVKGRAPHVDAAVSALLDAGEIVDRGTPSKHRYEVAHA
jgi:hypothetical protein